MKISPETVLQVVAGVLCIMIGICAYLLRLCGSNRRSPTAWLVALPYSLAAFYIGISFVCRSSNSLLLIIAVIVTVVDTAANANPRKLRGKHQ